MGMLLFDIHYISSLYFCHLRAITNVFTKHRGNNASEKVFMVITLDLLQLL